MYSFKYTKCYTSHATLNATLHLYFPKAVVTFINHNFTKVKMSLEYLYEYMYMYDAKKWKCLTDVCTIIYYFLSLNNPECVQEPKCSGGGVVAVETIIGMKMGHVATSHAHKVCSFPFSLGATHNTVSVRFNVVNQVKVSLKTFHWVPFTWSSFARSCIVIIWYSGSLLCQLVDESVLEVAQTHFFGAWISSQTVQNVCVWLAYLNQPQKDSFPPFHSFPSELTIVGNTLINTITTIHGKVVITNYSRHFNLFSSSPGDCDVFDYGFGWNKNTWFSGLFVPPCHTEDSLVVTTQGFWLPVV